MIGRRALFRRAVAAPAPRPPAPQWVRPPFALGEAGFLLACTRCDACIDACPHRIVFRLPKSAGLLAEGTPALDLLGGGCRLCEGWPCVAACAKGALGLPEAPEEGEAEAPPPLPRLATARIDPSSCLPHLGPECGACADSCPVPGALVWQGTRPAIDPAACVGCGLCLAACITDPGSITLRPLPRDLP